MPMVVLYIPTVDLIRLQGRITDSANIIVNRAVPFNLVKEIWFCIPKDNDRRGYELVEKIMDEQLEDELVLEYQASPILREFKKMKNRTSQRREREVAAQSCDLCRLPSGGYPSTSSREISSDLHVHKHTRPGDLLTGNGSSQVRLRLCPACYHLTPSCLSRCTTCWSLFISRGKFRRNEPARDVSPVEVPSVNIAQTMETATAAVPTTGPEEDDNLDAATVAEPEMEIEIQGSEAEPEHADDIPDFEQYQEDVSNETLEDVCD